MNPLIKPLCIKAQHLPNQDYEVFSAARLGLSETARVRVHGNKSNREKAWQEMKDRAA